MTIVLHVISVMISPRFWPDMHRDILDSSLFKMNTTFAHTSWRAFLVLYMLYCERRAKIPISRVILFGEPVVSIRLPLLRCFIFYYFLSQLWFKISSFVMMSTSRFSDSLISSLCWKRNPSLRHFQFDFSC